MHTATELPSFTRPPIDTRARLDLDTTAECDRCGQPVHRETAVEQGDGPDAVLLCAECEFGAD
ncbi:hypothetical protein [Anaeromyxobacter oryzae]|uniref:Small CPxCG-related zinc finger protein n=1 Tax=Anaeromyxobacter oryzae TaxID=2918170 RepID=A0ABN6MXC2_9BACT|nr:hypothetical protein [Anaeromyxobacter oryzae]BDG05599.1 hypothetical protein AMOR_45950 [Anaeromyxobacter oryzae]